MTNRGWGRRLRAAWQVLCGGAAAEDASVQPAAAVVDTRMRGVALELDLRDREQEIERLRREYARLELEQENVRAATGAASLEALFRRLAPPLSQLATAQAMVESGRRPRIEDVLKLSAKVEEVLAGEGLERVGAVGVELPFDPRLHQRMSSAEAQDSDRVTVRFVGFRSGAAIVLKAMVGGHGGERGAPTSR